MSIYNMCGRTFKCRCLYRDCYQEVRPSFTEKYQQSQKKP